MEQHSKGYNALLALQITLFLLGRLLDDLSWYDVGVENEVNVFEGVGIACMTICIFLQIIRKRRVHSIMKVLFFHSQLKFFIAWALEITIVILFFNVFKCKHTLPESELAYFYVDYNGCVLNATQLILTVFNYSMLCNTKADRAEFMVYEVILFGEIIYNGKLMLLFINNLEGHAKEESILLISVVIANQVLIMDLLFRAAYEDKEREEER
jgi:hypothetical protein